MNLSNKETKILDLVLEYIPYYGAFDLSEKIKLIKNDKFQEIWNNLTNPVEQILTIQLFLVEHGYAIKRNDEQPTETYIELKERGRWLKEQGSMESYRQYQTLKKEKNLLAEDEKAMAVQRNVQMNRLTLWIAVFTGVAAIYYLFGLFDYYEKHTLNWELTLYFFSGFVLAILLCLIITQYRKAAKKDKKA